jgi:hypothetical protein
MRLPDSAHTERPWLIHDLTRDFRVEDVWALATPGGPDDFVRLVAVIGALDMPPVVRALLRVRWKAGEVLGWDGTTSAGEQPSFTTLYQTHDEWAREISNRTVRGILHLGWVPDAAGGYRGQLAVLVKRNGLLGAVYMAAIAPARHLIVYPALIGAIERAWMNRLSPG